MNLDEKIEIAHPCAAEVFETLETHGIACAFLVVFNEQDDCFRMFPYDLESTFADGLAKAIGEYIDGAIERASKRSAH
jgi:hypothetical protein